MNKIYLETLLPNTVNLVKVFQLKKPQFLNEFYLSEGTGLSLQLGHRKSEDLDFFSKNSFKPNILLEKISKLGRLENVELEKGTLNIFLNKVKVQFLEYPYKLLEKPYNLKGIKISSLIDIACTKLLTIGMRGSKKDFIDIYFLLKKYTLKKLFEKLDKKYINLNYNQVHILKSLLYFKNAESQPMPKMLIEIDWQKVKKTITQKVISFQL